MSHELCSLVELIYVKHKSCAWNVVSPHSTLFYVIKDLNASMLGIQKLFSQMLALNGQFTVVYERGLSLVSSGVLPVSVTPPPILKCRLQLSGWDSATSRL